MLIFSSSGPGFALTTSVFHSDSCLFQEGVSDLISHKVIVLALELHSHPPLALIFSISGSGLNARVSNLFIYFLNKGQLVNILGFVVYKASVTTIQLCHCSGKAAIKQYVNKLEFQ